MSVKIEFKDNKNLRRVRRCDGGWWDWSRREGLGYSVALQELCRRCPLAVTESDGSRCIVTIDTSGMDDTLRKSLTRRKEVGFSDFGRLEVAIKGSCVELARRMGEATTQDTINTIVGWGQLLKAIYLAKKYQLTVLVGG